MNINLSQVTFSSIVGIGEKIQKVEKDTNTTFLKLNRGVNSVCNIDLSEIIKNIDFNSREAQVYAPNLGIASLRKSIAKYYFDKENDFNNICVTPGGMPALDIVLQTLNVEKVMFPKFYWGSYSKMATIRNKSYSFYDSLSNIDLNDIDNSTCIFICDPNNPTGMKIDDKLLLESISDFTKKGAIVLFDSPYRLLYSGLDFLKEDVYHELSIMDNVIICDSFSKSIGLSGFRLGFIWCKNKDFNRELNIRMLYQFNAISTVPQLIINELLSTNIGEKVIKDFRDETVKHITQNIQYLKDKNFLENDIYLDGSPVGIFAIVKFSEDYLFKHQIGSVGLDKFVYHDKDLYSGISRICVSVPHTDFVSYFDKLI